MNLTKMVFKKLEQTVNFRKKLSVDATYNINAEGRGTLRFTRNGIDKLEKDLGIDYKKQFNLYTNEETQSLAFEISETGPFKLSGPEEKKAALCYQDLSKVFTKKMYYMIVPSESYSFVLVPEELYSQLQTATVEEPVAVEAQPPVVEAKKADESPSSTESPSPSPAKKARLKKKQS
ncbi:MAG: hypothetical protein WAQ98_00950 [Blastocatellia bacterium]